MGRVVVLLSVVLPAIVLVAGLRSGVFYGRGPRPTTRTDNPIAYWTTVMVLGIGLAIVVLVLIAGLVKRMAH